MIGSAGELMGVLSLDDILELLASSLKDLAGAVRNAQRFESQSRT